MKQTTLSTTAWNRIKEKASHQTTLRRVVDISELKVVSNDHIELDGVGIKMTKDAFKMLLNALRIPSAFVNRWMKGFGSEGLQSLIDAVKQISPQSEVALMVDINTREIVAVMKASSPGIDNESFFNTIERYIDEYDLSVNTADSNGTGAIINCSTDGAFKIPGMEREVFQTGVTFRNTPDKGIQVSPYMTRLWCANGMTTKSIGDTISLNSLSEHNIRRFNEHMLTLAANSFKPRGFQDMVTRAMNTNASLNELQKANNMIAKAIGRDNEFVERYAPIIRSSQAYKILGHDPAEFTQEQMRRADSGVKVWDVVNGMTNAASNAEGKFTVARGNLAVGAGQLLANKYNLEDEVTVNPFAKNNLLSEAQLERLRGES